MTECEDLTQDDIYDDGVSITNKIAFGGIKTVFEPTSGTGPKPKVPNKPGHKVPPCLTPRNNVNTNKGSAMNGSVGVPILPAKSGLVRDGNETKSANNGEKRRSKVNIPGIFANANSDDSLKTSPKPPVPWSQRNKETDVKNEHSKENSNKVTPNLQEKPPWSVRQRGATDNEMPVPPNTKPKPGLPRAVNTTDSGPKSPNIEKTDESHPQIQKKRPSVLEKYGISEKTINPIVTSPKPVMSPRTNEKETSDEKNESQSSVQSSPKRPPANALPFGGISNIESLKGKLKHVTPGGNSRDKKLDENVNLRNKINTSSGEKRKSIIRKSLTRKVDGLKFYVVDFDDVKSANNRPPVKPPKLKEKFDLDKIIANYQASLVDMDPSSSKNGVTEEDEELYEPIPADEDVPMRESVSRESRAVSLIQPMTEDDEFDSQEEYDDCEVMKPAVTKPAVPKVPLPELPSSNPPARLPKSQPAIPGDDTQEEYDDCVVAQTEELDQDDVYEPLDDLSEIKEENPVEEETKKDTAKVEEKKDDKLSEKERKKREKDEQKRIKEEKKKQEKEYKELKSKFKVEPFQLENTQGEGNVRKDAKGGKLDLQVKSGQRVVLVRLVNNPAGKWLVKLKEDGKVGYVDSNNVEVDNTVIRNVMEGSYVNMHQLSNNANNDIDQEEYADADVEQQEEYADVEAIEPIQDDLYEEC